MMFVIVAPIVRKDLGEHSQIKLHPQIAMEDVDRKMLRAIMDEADGLPRAELSLFEMKQYLKDNIGRVDVTARTHVGRVLIQTDNAKLVQPCAVGTVVNLRNVPESVIGLMYAELQHRMTHRK
jgi:hypothetical protein